MDSKYRPLEDTRKTLRQMLFLCRDDKHLRKLLVMQLWFINRAINLNNLRKNIITKSKNKQK